MQVDTRGARAKIARFEADIKDILSSVAQELEFQFQAYAEENFQESGGSGFNTSSKLRVQSGGLTRSLIPGQPGNISDVRISADGRLNMRVGTKLVYAKVHEYGGFIKSKGRMEKKLMALYYQTHDKMYLYTSLSVKKKGGIKLKARPWFHPAVQRMIQSGKKRIANKITRMVLASFKKM